MRKIFRSLALAMMASLASGSVFAGDWKIPEPTYMDFVPGDTFYVWNVGQQGFISNGEARGLQAVVSSTSGLKLTFTAQSGGGYQAKDSYGGSTWTYMFRVQTDRYAGSDVHTLFVDNNGAGNKNIYNINKVGDNNIYKMSMVDYDSDASIYTSLKGEDETFNYALGVQLDHKSAYAASNQDGVTHAIYYDIAYMGQADCHWAFVSQKEFETYVAKTSLLSTMEEAEQDGVSTASAEAVLNDRSATAEDVNAAINALTQDIADNVTPEKPKDFTSLIAQADCEGSETELRAVWKAYYIGGDGTSADDIQNKTWATDHTAKYNLDGEEAFSGKAYVYWDPNPFAAWIYQDVENVPNGVYNVQLSAFVNVADADNAINKTQYVFFNDTKVLLKSDIYNHIYSAIIRIADNKLRLGLAQDSVMANWMGIDNAKLIYYGGGLTSAQYISNNLLTTAKTTIDEGGLYSESYMTALKNVVATANAATTVDEAFAAYVPAKEAYDALIANMEAYSQLEKLADIVSSALYDEGLAVDDMFERIETILGDATATTDEILAEMANDNTELEQLRKASYKAGADVTSILVTNPNFNDATSTQVATALSTAGWTTAKGTFGGNKDMAEAFNCGFDIYQDLTNIQSGAYRLDVQTFYRTEGGLLAPAWKNWKATNGEDRDENKIESFIYAGNVETPFNNIFAWPGLDTKGESGSWLSYDRDGETKYLPNDVASAAEAFSDATRYNTSVIGIAVDGKLRIGLMNTGKSVNNKYWSAWNDVKLTYLGNDVTVMAPALQTLLDKATALAAYNMNAEAKSTLNNCISAATTAISDADSKAIMTAYEALAAAMKVANSSIPYYTILEGKLDTLVTTLEQKRETAAASAISTAESLISEVKAGLSAGSYTDEETVEKGKEVDAATKALYTPQGEASDATPLDYTYNIVNPNFTNGSTGWTASDIVSASSGKSTSVSDNMIEMWNCSGELYQDISGLPAGTYQLTAKGFFRDANSANASEAFANGTYETRGYMFARTQADDVWYQDSVALSCIVWIDELAKSAGSAEGNWSKYIDSTDVSNPVSYYYPSKRAAARERFDAGEDIYSNSLYVTVPDNGFIRIGVFNHSAKSNDWLVVTDWKLYYLGTNSSHTHHGTLTGIGEINNNTETVCQEIFTIDGRKVNALGKGLNIVRYRDANGKTTIKKILIQ